MVPILFSVCMQNNYIYVVCRRGLHPNFASLKSICIFAVKMSRLEIFLVIWLCGSSKAQVGLCLLIK
jgi:hypothetical protein